MAFVFADIVHVEAILNGIDISDPMGVRDRSILEVLYNTGMRRMKVIALRWDDFDIKRGTIFIREGKVDRMVPIGERVLLWCEKYLHEVQPQFDLTGHDPAFFLTSLGESVTPNLSLGT